MDRFSHYGQSHNSTLPPPHPYPPAYSRTKSASSHPSGVENVGAPVAGSVPIGFWFLFAISGIDPERAQLSSRSELVQLDGELGLAAQAGDDPASVLVAGGQVQDFIPHGSNPSFDGVNAGLSIQPSNIRSFPENLFLFLLTLVMLR